MTMPMMTIPPNTKNGLIALRSANARLFGIARVSVSAKRVLRKALIRAAKTSQTAGTLGET
jgi:hypothetical protein